MLLNQLQKKVRVHQRQNTFDSLVQFSSPKSPICNIPINRRKPSCSVTLSREQFFSHTRQWMIEPVHEIQLWMLRVYYISRQLYYIGHVTSIVFHCFQGRPYHLVPLTSLWRHDLSPLIRTALPIDVAFSEIYLSIILRIGLLWRLWRRFAVCSFRTNQTFGCWIQI